MCGFAGFVGAPDRARLDAMGERIRERGPDQDGAYEDAGFSVAHKRLAIIDLSPGGRQPLVSPDGRFVLAYNGEIYNFQELRRRYEVLGWTFRTRTDSECFLAAAALGTLEDDLRLFHGMFAFVLWDAREKTLAAARDHLGIKPFFHAEAGGRFAFASELKALLPLRPEGWEIDRASRAAYLGVGYVPGPATMFAGIRQLPPGRLFRIEAGRLREGASFAPVAPEERLATEPGVPDRLRALVDRTVAAQLVSDRPVGIFLSGGVDSSVVVASVRAVRPDAALRTYTTRFADDSGDPKFNLDADLARKTAARYGCTHTEITVSAGDFIENAERMAWSLGQPNHNHSIVALDAVAKLAAQEVAVALSGDGGDEVFGGYDRYRLQSWLGTLGRLPLVRPALRSMAGLAGRKAEFLDDDEAVRLLAFYAPPSAALRTLFTEAWDPAPLVERWHAELATIDRRDSLRRLMELDRRTWLRDEAFLRVDHLVMRHGLEVRVPLVDDALLAFAAGLPRADLANPWESKRLWRRTFADRCLPEVIHGKKRGWFPPTAKWLRTGLRDWAEALVEEAIAEHPWIDGPLLRRRFADHVACRRYAMVEIWTVAAYQLWWRAHKAHVRGA